MGNDPLRENLLEAAIEGGDSAIGHLLDQASLGDIPFIGLAVRACRLVDGLHERAFAAKLTKFLLTARKIPIDEWNTTKYSIAASRDERKRVAETLMMVLDRLTDLEKPEILAWMFIAYLEKLIAVDELLRYWHIIAESYVGDLKTLLGYPTQQHDGKHVEYLLGTGLTQTVVGQTWANQGQVRFQVAPLGNRFIEVFHVVKEKYEPRPS